MIDGGRAGRRRGRGSYGQTQVVWPGTDPTRSRHELTSAPTRIHLNRWTRNDDYGRATATMDGNGRDASTTDRGTGALELRRGRASIRTRESRPGAGKKFKVTEGSHERQVRIRAKLHEKGRKSL